MKIRGKKRLTFAISQDFINQFVDAKKSQGQDQPACGQQSRQHVESAGPGAHCQYPAGTAQAGSPG